MMKKKILVPDDIPVSEYNCTELELHTYVDGELDYLERAHVLNAAQKSAAIRTKLNELEQLKQLVKLGYADISYKH